MFIPVSVNFKQRETERFIKEALNKKNMRDKTDDFKVKLNCTPND